MSTASTARPGSMRAYAETLGDAIERFLPDIEAERIELGSTLATRPHTTRWETLAMPFRFRGRRRLAPDLWHILDGSRAYLANALPGARTIITSHDVIPWLQAQGHFPEADAVGWGSRALWRSNGRAMRRAARIVCDSAATARDVQAQFSVTADRCEVVPLPLRPTLTALLERVASAPEPARDEGIVLHVGNNAFYKNRVQMLELFAAMDAVLARRLVMLGPPPTAELLDAMRSLALEDRVTWLDDPDDAELVGWYRRASVLLFPSLYEGFGWPVLEALSFGLPVITSDRGSLPEVPGIGGSCMPLEEPFAIVHRAMQILRDPVAAQREVRQQQSEALACNARRFAEHMGEVYRMATASDARAVA